jgi:hypothetical protein
MLVRKFSRDIHGISSPETCCFWCSKDIASDVKQQASGDAESSKLGAQVSQAIDAAESGRLADIQAAREEREEAAKNKVSDADATDEQKTPGGM